MATKPTSQNKGGVFHLPQFLSIKDMITIVSIAVSLTLAWGVFTTRITLIEKEVVQLQADNDKQTATIEKLQDEIHQYEINQRMNSVLIDQLYILLKKPTPYRESR